MSSAVILPVTLKPITPPELSLSRSIMLCALLMQGLKPRYFDSVDAALKRRSTRERRPEDLPQRCDSCETAVYPTVAEARFPRVSKISSSARRHADCCILSSGQHHDTNSGPRWRMLLVRGRCVQPVAGCAARYLGLHGRARSKPKLRAGVHWQDRAR